MSRTETSAAVGLGDPALLSGALISAFAKFDPRVLIRNPVIFVVGIVSLLGTLLIALNARQGASWSFSIQVIVWLWATVLFANFAEAMAEGRGKAQAATLRLARSETMAKRLADVNADPATAESVPGPMLAVGDIIIVAAGETIPGDGDVIAGAAFVDEAAITGESAPVIRESGGDRSAVTGGTRVLTDTLRIRITAAAGDTFLDRMIALVEGASRQKTPNEIALAILLAGLTLIFVFAVATIPAFATYAGGHVSILVLVALFVTLIPTTIGGLLSAIGIAGMDRLVRFNVLAMSGRAVEAAGDVDTLLLDKTGTITIGNREAVAFLPLSGVSEKTLAEAAQGASLADETPEGRSILTLAAARHQLQEAAVQESDIAVPFSANTRLSGLDRNGVSLRKGAIDSVLRQAGDMPVSVRAEMLRLAEGVARSGGTPLGVSRDGVLLGVVHLKDIVKSGLIPRFQELRRMGIRTVMITGDNPLTAAAIAAEAGVDDFLAEASPENKLALIRSEQAEGKLVAMCGDGTNDAPALAQADVGVAMNTGTMAAREAGNMIDLDSDPTKLIEIVAIGKQMLITRGALTTFSIANDVAKYFAIIPAMFASFYPQLGVLNVMRLHSPESAVLSAVIFNALIIVALIPLALRGVHFRPNGAAATLRRNLLIYGLGGIVAPFIAIKVIDVALVALHLV